MSEERRRYFRIDDSLGLAYRLLGSEEAKVFALEAREQGNNFSYADNFDNRIQTLLDACKIQAPVAAELIDLMNKKLNFVIQQLDINSALMQTISYSLKNVNVSACGMAFANEECLEKGQQLHLDIVLYPAELHVVAMAEVLSCTLWESDDTESENHWFVRLNFTEINSSDQELLIQHIVKRQSAILTQRRREQMKK